MNEVFALTGSGLPLRTNAQATRAGVLGLRYAFTLPPRQAVRLAQTRIAFPGVDLSPLEPQAPVEGENEAFASKSVPPSIGQGIQTALVTPRIETIQQRVESAPEHAESQRNSQNESQRETVIVRMEKAAPDALSRVVETERESERQHVPAHHSNMAEASDTAQSILKAEGQPLETALRVERIDSETTHSILEQMRIYETTPQVMPDKAINESNPVPLSMQQASIAHALERALPKDANVEDRHAPLTTEVIQRLFTMGVPDSIKPPPQSVALATPHPLLERIAAATTPVEEKAIRIGSVQVSVRSPAPLPVPAPIVQTPLASDASMTAARPTYRSPWLKRNRQD